MTREEVQQALDMIRPNLQADGGDVELVDVTAEGTVKVKLTGACQGCPMSQMTFKIGIQQFLQRHIPEVKEVISIA